MVFVNFHEINVFENNAKKTSNLDSFSEAETTKNREKIVLKSVCYFKLRFFRFFCDFSRFWLDFGKPRAVQKFKKFEKNRFCDTFSFEGGFWEGSGGVLGRF